jgi:CelD/BcsL family acetyltransferase involved in cellulose biosynthesis
VSDNGVVTELITPRALSREDIARWREINQGSPSLRSPFLSYFYTAAAEQVFRRVKVAKFVRKGTVVGFFPFQFQSYLHQALGWAERVSGELSDSFGIVADSTLRLTATQLLRLSRLSALYFTHLEESQKEYGLDGEQPETGLRIEFPDGGEAYWGELRRLDGKFTADTERRERKLVQAFGPVDFVFRHADSRHALEHLIAAKRAQYARTDAGDSLSRASARDFLFALSTGHDADCIPVLSTLHAGETWVASHFGLQCGSTLHYWFPVYNPDMRAFSPGRLLVRALIRESAALGITAIDRGAGDSQAKRDFANSERRYLRGVWYAPGFAGIAYRAGLSGIWRLRSTTASLAGLTVRRINSH